jgi:hypothetical protein
MITMTGVVPQRIDFAEQTKRFDLHLISIQP